jgi:prepilin-type N-terminal cleavage/methylation domain-containing protein
MRISSPSRASRAAGFTLIELLLVITIVGALSAILVLGAYRNGRQREALAQGSLAVLFASNIESAWSNQPNYSSLTAATAYGYAPGMFQNATGSQGGTLQSLYGSITAGPTTETYTGGGPFAPASFAIQFSGVPQDLCALFAGSAASAFDNVVINSNANYAKVSGASYNATLAVQECSQASNTVTFTRMRSYPISFSGFCLVPTTQNPTPYSPASLTSAMWVWSGSAQFSNSMDGTTYYTNPPAYDHLYAPDGTPVC